MRGRPPKQTGRITGYSIRLSAARRARWEAYAAALDMPLSDAIRNAVDCDCDRLLGYDEAYGLGQDGKP